MQITLTPKAVTEVKKILTEQNMAVSTHFLRIGVSGGGCSGFNYSLGFDENLDPMNDMELQFEDLKVVTDRKSLMFLEGVTLDFYDGIEKRGFTFNNPNATGGCGCNKSFSV